MKTPSLFLSAFAGALGLASCSLPEQSKVAATELKPGVRYEVRRALPVDATGVPRDVPAYSFMLQDPVSPSEGLSDAAKDRRVRTTAYCHAESDHIRYGSLAAAGAPLRFGMVCSAAADWSRYPVGTTFRIKSQPGVVYEVDDYGSALVGSGTIDLYRPTMGSMSAWGVREVDIEIVKWGSYEQSLRLMRNAVHYPHVRQMMIDIRRQMDQVGDTKPSQTTPITAMNAPTTAA